MSLKRKQFRAPCLCGCGKTSPSTIAAHSKELAKKAKLTSLDIARFVSGHPEPSTPSSVPSNHLARQNPTQPIEDVDYTANGPMEVDSVANRSSSLLDRVWAGRASQCGREDEDLVPVPGSPESSEDEEEAENDERKGFSDEPDFLSDDDEPTSIRPTPVHLGISARDQLTVDYQSQAARAGAFLTAV